MNDPRPIPAFSDNYIWCFQNDNGDCCVVDPGDAKPVLSFLENNNLNLAGILITHHHFDHVGGIAALTEKYNIPVYGPNNPKISGITHPLREGDEIAVLGATFSILEVPGHTLDHIAYIAEGAEPAPWLFCGDTLFSGGCGRLFEGAPGQMLASLIKLSSLPGSTKVFCTHEYTLANLEFALSLMPKNKKLLAYQQQCLSLRSDDAPTLPTSIELEAAINPFLRWEDPELIQNVANQNVLQGNESAEEVFAATRRLKDSF